MDITKRNIKRHLFICCNEKPSPKDCCSSKNPKELIGLIKSRLRENDLWASYKVTASGCLGPCSSGVSAVLYPDNLLFTNLSVADFEELYALLIS